MLRAYRVLGLLACYLSVINNVRAEHLNWGMEASQCGNNVFNIIAGNGGDIYLTNISGIISAAIIGSDAMTERAALFSMTGNTPVNGSVVGNPSTGGYNHEVNQGLFVASVKQVGNNVVHIPFNVDFPTPMLIPAGMLAANIAIATSNPSTNPAPNLCLDAEVHVELVWQTTPPASTASR